jgi:hypothetical protein
VSNRLRFKPLNSESKTQQLCSIIYKLTLGNNKTQCDVIIEKYITYTPAKKSLVVRIQMNLASCRRENKLFFDCGKLYTYRYMRNNVESFTNVIY